MAIAPEHSQSGRGLHLPEHYFLRCYAINRTSNSGRDIHGWLETRLLPEQFLSWQNIPAPQKMHKAGWGPGCYARVGARKSTDLALILAPDKLISTYPHK